MKLRAEKMPAGDRSTKIIIEAATAVENAMGGRKLNWEPHLEAWASVNYGTGAERRVAGQEQANQTATFRIYSSRKAREITSEHRLKISGSQAEWDIVSVVPFGLNQDIDITATRK